MAEGVTSRAPWQFSLATILVFIFAVAIWLLLATRGEILVRSYLTGCVVAGAVVLGLIARRRGERAVLLLIAVFLLIVLGSHSYLRQEFLRELEIREVRRATLHQISTAVAFYEAFSRGYPPPATSLESSGADLFRLLAQPVKMRTATHGPFIAPVHAQTVNGVPHLTGALGSQLLWAKLPSGKYILIDTGPDNLPGGMLDANGVYTPGPVDVNGDGVTDGADDLSVFLGE